MGRKKQQRIKEAVEMANVFSGQLDKTKHWLNFFKNNRPIILELGCGRGDYTVALAKLWPHFNFVGLDKKGARLWHGAKKAWQNKITNVAFLRIDIKNLTQFFLPQSINQIWLTFPDPFPRRRQAKKRLTHPAFLLSYKEILQPGGQIHLKTDSQQLFAYSLKTFVKNGYKKIIKTNDLYNSQLQAVSYLQIITAYEKRYLAKGKKIFYAAWRI